MIDKIIEHRIKKILNESIKISMDDWNTEIPKEKVSKNILSKYDYNFALQKLVKYITKLNKDYDSSFQYNQFNMITYKVGPKYTKIFVNDKHDKGRIWGFVDKNTGDIFRAATYKAPAKIARGNIFDEKTWKKFTNFGPQYLI